MRASLSFLLLALLIPGCGRGVDGAPVPDAMDAARVPDAPAPPDDGLPNGLGFVYERGDLGEPVPPAEVTAFTRRLCGFLAKVGYFDWVLRTSHGVHPDTGKRDWTIWWSGVLAEKSGDTVTFVHKETSSPTSAGGGHNLMTRTTKVLSSAVAGYLVSSDATMGKVVEGYCKGIGATMLGMVYDEDDELHHLMARNVIAFNHEYVTHDGRKAAVDYSNWYHDGEGWNTQRFEYPNNPWWGSVWVTNMRSKDDVSRLYRAAAMIRYAANRAPDPAAAEACSETYDLLVLFARDIVDHDYRIRTKDEDGAPFLPGIDRETEWPEERKDLSSYSNFDTFFPLGQCNAKRAAAFLGYDAGLENDCGLGYGSVYEHVAVESHYFNNGIIRSHHVSHLMQALVHEDHSGAAALLDGMVDRFESDIADYPSPGIYAPWDEWSRDLGAHLLQGAIVGYPLNGEEVRLIHRYYQRAIDRYLAWPHWDLWDPAIAGGTYEYKPPDREGVDPDEIHWIRVEDMAAALDVCWSPFRNPAGHPAVDCEIVRDVASWDPAWADE